MSSALVWTFQSISMLRLALVSQSQSMLPSALGLLSLFQLMLRLV